jgi:hypothetical protein
MKFMTRAAGKKAAVAIEVPLLVGKYIISLFLYYPGIKYRYANPLNVTLNLLFRFRYVLLLPRLVQTLTFYGFYCLV